MAINRWLLAFTFCFMMPLTIDQTAAASRRGNSYEAKIEDYEAEQRDLRERSILMNNKLRQEILQEITVGFAMLDEVLHDEKLSEDARKKHVGRILGEMARTTFPAMRHEYDDPAPDGRVNFLDKIKLMSFEIWRDMKSFVVPHLERRGDKSIAIWDRFRPLEASRREALVDEIQKLFSDKIEEYADYMKTADPGVKEFFYGQMHYLTDRAVNMRAERHASQVGSRMAYFYAGLFFTLHPFMNYWSNDNYYGWLNSGMINLAVATTLFTIKSFTGSMESTADWVRFLDRIEELNDKETLAKIRSTLKEHFSGEYFEPRVPRMLRFELNARKALAKAWRATTDCASLLDKKKKSS